MSVLHDPRSWWSMSVQCRTRELGQPCGQCDASRMERRSRETCRSNCTDLHCKRVCQIQLETCQHPKSQRLPGQSAQIQQRLLTGSAALIQKLMSFWSVPFCNLLSHGFKELFLCETHTDTDLEAEPRSTTNPCDMRWFLGVCTARLFELTATRSRQTLNREELVWISGGIRCTYSWMVSISLYAHIYTLYMYTYIYMYNIYICIIYIYTYVLVYTLYIYIFIV